MRRPPARVAFERVLRACAARQALRPASVSFHVGVAGILLFCERECVLRCAKRIYELGNITAQNLRRGGLPDASGVLQFDYWAARFLLDWG